MSPAKPSSPEANDLHWHAVYTRPRAEKQVWQRLNDQGIEAFLPLRKTLRQWSDRKKLVEIPLFTSYVFVKIDRSDYDRVLQVPGVVKYIFFEGRAAVIRQREIDNLRILVDSNADVETTWERFEKGEQVVVTAGALKGLSGELISQGNRKRVLVRIDRIDQNLVVEVPPGLLERARQ
ncbi:MAG: UpxY family transcription antiterminator [Bacteroidota bacterium]